MVLLKLNQVKVNHELEEKYKHYYQTDEISFWRELGARAKAKNIVELSEYQNFNKVLEVGAGDGAILQILNDAGFCKELSALEISESGIEKIKSRKLNLLKALTLFDGYKIPFTDQEFDLVYCSHVIEHVEHPRLLLREIKRVSKQQIFEVPIDFSFRVDKKVDHFLSYGHINIYTPALFRFLLKSEKFKIIKDRVKILDNEVNSYILKQKKAALPFLKYFVFWLKTSIFRFIWKLLPKGLKEIKPQTYTVLTQNTEE